MGTIWIASEIKRLPFSHYLMIFPFPSPTPQVDEIKGKDRTIFALEKELESTSGYLQKLQLQKDALDEQLFLVKEAECGLGSPKREIPGRAGDGAEHCGSPVSRETIEKQLRELKQIILNC